MGQMICHTFLLRWMRWGAAGLGLAGWMMMVMASAGRGAELTVYAAASLSEVLTEVGIEYKRSTGDTLLLNLGASSLLARQVQQGARADLFFSADEEKMDGLDKAGLLWPGTRTNLLSNSLVIVVAQGSSLRMENARDLLQVKRLALAEPGTVPAGIYARRFLQDQRIWEALKERVIPTENVRAALATVEAGHAEAALVYRTDAARLRQSRVALVIAPEATPWITYPAAVLRESRQPEKARQLLAYLQSPAARDLFRKHGFITRY